VLTARRQTLWKRLVAESCERFRGVSAQVDAEHSRAEQSTAKQAKLARVVTWFNHQPHQRDLVISTAANGGHSQGVP
jgi:hypothetical protein